MHCLQDAFALRFTSLNITQFKKLPRCLVVTSMALLVMPWANVHRLDMQLPAAALCPTTWGCSSLLEGHGLGGTRQISVAALQPTDRRADCFYSCP